jgi:hypothetical protein
MPAGSITLRERMIAPFTKFAGMKRARFAFDGWKGDFTQRFQNKAGVDYIPLIGSDSLDNPLLCGQTFTGILTPINLRIEANAKIAQTIPFFVNANDGNPLEIVRIDCIFDTADGAANTGYVSKDIQGNLAGAGKSVMSGTFNLNATANTLQTSSLYASTLVGTSENPSLSINPGEQLTFNIASAVTNLAGLSVTVWVRPHTGASFATFSRVANGDIATATMYLNLIPGQTIRAISMRWNTAGTDAGTVTATVTRDTGTTAPGAGTNMLAAAQSVKGAAGTTVFPALTATTANLTMAAGDRLAVLMAGTLTALAGLVVTVFFSASARDHIVVPLSFWDAQSTNRTIFISNAYYIVTDYWGVWSTASSSNTQALTKDSGTTAPGSGTVLLTDNTNAGIGTSATANTPVEGTLITTARTGLWLGPGDRLGVKNAGTATGLAGNFSAVVLRAA